MISRLTDTQGSPEELGLTELAQYAAKREGSDRVEAQLLWQRRILLSVTPLIFCILGSAMMLRFNRGGRGFGTFLALLSLVVYYLLAFLGEQLTRVGTLSVVRRGDDPDRGNSDIGYLVLFFAEDEVSRAAGGLYNGHWHVASEQAAGNAVQKSFYRPRSRFKRR